MITEEDKKLIKLAKNLVGSKEVRGGAVKEVGCALVTENGKIFTGVSLHLSCGIGFCAEHTAIANMITQTDETQIKTIIAIGKDKIMPPCGRCREMMNLIDEKNFKTEVIISKNKKIKLKELLPHTWDVK